MPNTFLFGCKILCDGYVIERHGEIDNILIFNILLYNGYVIEKIDKGLGRTKKCSNRIRSFIRKPIKNIFISHVIINSYEL